MIGLFKEAIYFLCIGIRGVFGFFLLTFIAFPFSVVWSHLIFKELNLFSGAYVTLTFIFSFMIAISDGRNDDSAEAMKRFLEKLFGFPKDTTTR